MLTFLYTHTHTHTHTDTHIQAQPESKLHDRVEALMQLLFDIDMMRKSMLEMEV
jgi:hypothetical protein